MTIKEVESRTELVRANIRYYESQGLISPVRRENGYREYTQQDVDTLLKILHGGDTGAPEGGA